MRKNNTSIYSQLVLIALLFGIFLFMMPQSYDQTEAPLSEFSTKRALSIVKEISKKPHFVGSKNHEVISNYLQKELQDLQAFVKDVLGDDIEIQPWDFSFYSQKYKKHLLLIPST